MGNSVQPIWVIVSVPEGAAPGDYEGKLTVAVGNARPFVVPVKLTVCDWRLPEPRDFQTFVELIQSPETVAMAYEVPLWSEKHFQLMEKSLALMGKAGCKTTCVHLMCETNQGNSETMVRWIRQKDGSYRHDFSVMDRYLDLVEKHQGTPAIVCLYAWDRVFVDAAKDDYHLASSSPFRDAGGPVTVTTSMGSGTTIQVSDSGYFTDGMGLTSGDTIRIGSAEVSVVDIPSATTIVVDTSVSWESGTGVYFPYEGSAPDLGALETETLVREKPSISVLPEH